MLNTFKSILIGSVYLGVSLYGCGVQSPPQPPSTPLVYVGRRAEVLIISGQYKDCPAQVLDHTDDDENFTVILYDTRDINPDLKSVCDGSEVQVRRSDIVLIPKPHIKSIPKRI